jgi:hypothetical protein
VVSGGNIDEAVHRRIVEAAGRGNVA